MLGTERGKRALALVLGLLMAGPLSAVAATLDLKQCVAVALKQNPDIQASQAQLAQAEGALRQARGQQWPKLTASVTATRSNDALNAFGLKLAQRNATFNDFGASQFVGPASLPVAPVNLNHPDPVNNYNTRLEVQIPLYNGGLISGYVDQAHAFVKAAQQGDAAARQQVIFRVVQAYQGVHAARAYVKVAQQALAAAEAYVKTSRNLLREGVVVRSDLLSAEVNLGDVRVKLEEARHASASALDQLHLLLGIPLDQALDVGADFVPAALSGDIAKLQAEALEANPGVRALRHQLDGAGANVAVAKADYYPHFNAMLRQDWNNPTLRQTAPSYTVAGVLSWSVLDFGVTRGAVDRAEASRSEMQARLRQAEEGVRYQVADAWRGAMEAEERVKAREIAVKQAEEAQRLVQKRYENGVANMVEVLSALAQLDKARADLVAAHYQLTVQRSALRLAAGVLDAEQL
ncbi:MAG: TolC family protein [Burkholderiales bacterium]